MLPEEGQITFGREPHRASTLLSGAEGESVNRRAISLAALLCVSAFSLVGCRAQPTTTSPAAPSAASDGCITSFDAERDYFPDKSTFQVATNVTIEYHKSYKVVTVKQPAPGAKAESYVLVQCGAPKPELSGDLAKAPVVTIPVKRAALSSTTQVPFYELLDRVGSVAGVGNADLISDGPMKDAIDAGKVASMKQEGMSVSPEGVAAVKPDVFITSGISDPGYAKIATLGIPVVADAEWLENTPLGRAEWIKFMGALLNSEAKANTTFDKIKSDYDAVAAKVRDASNRPTVLSGSLYKGTFYAAAADGYVGALIKDAGGDYILANETKGTGSNEMGLEKVLATGSKAKVWINASSSRWKNLSDALATDARLGELQAVKDGQVWTSTKRINAKGGNDYWQSGVVRPDQVLADLAKIFHPDVMRDHEFVYYEQVPAK